MKLKMFDGLKIASIGPQNTLFFYFSPFLGPILGREADLSAGSTYFGPSHGRLAGQLTASKQACLLLVGRLVDHKVGPTQGRAADRGPIIRSHSGPAQC